MFKNKKLVAKITAFLFIITTLFVPLFGQLVAYASPSYTIDKGDVLTINQKVGVEYNHDVSEQFDFLTFTSDASVQVIIYNPQGFVERDWTEISEKYTFKNIGLYALQFKKIGANFDTYSLNYYINVYQNEYSFVLDSPIVNAAKVGTSITLPSAKYVCKGIKEDAKIKVFNPYGTEVALTDNTFVVSELFVGNYYIEYYYQNEDIKQAVTYKIAVSKDFVVPNNLTISLANAEGQLDFKDTIDVFKFYNLKNAKLTAPNGSAINSQIKVSVYNQSSQKYYVVDGDRWVESDDEEFYDISSEELIDFVCSDISSFKEKGFGKAGDSFVFNFVALSCYGQTITKSVTKSLVFNDKILAIDILGYIPSQIHAKLNSSLTSIVSEETQNMTIAGFDIVFADGYDKDAIQSLINFEKIAVVSNNGSFVEEGDNFKLTYPEEIRASYSFNIEFKIKYFDKDIDPEETSYTLTMLSKVIKVESLNLEEVKPNNITIGSYNAIHRFESNSMFLLPQASANFYYKVNVNEFEELNRYNFSVYIDGVLAEGVLPGDEIELDTEKIYKITYSAKGYYGEAREFDFYVNSISEKTTNSELSTSQISKDNNTFTIQNAAVDQVFVYDNKGDFVSINSIYTQGFVSEFEADFKTDKTYYITLVYIAEDITDYITFACYSSDLLDQEQVLPLSYNINKDFYKDAKVLQKYDSVEVVVGQGVVLLEGELDNNFSFESSNPNYYVFEGVIYFYKAGSYTINAGSVKYHVKVVDNANKTVEYYKPISPVAKVGESVKLVDPVLTNSFGYTLERHITKSNGQVYTNLSDFEINAVDAYKVSYRFVDSEGNKFSDSKIISAGNTTKPTIILDDLYKDIVYKDGKTTVSLVSAYGLDKNGKIINEVVVEVYDPFGKKIEIVEEKFDVDKTGVYTLYYTLQDEDGIVNTEKISFISAYPNTEAKSDKLPVWAIVLISISSAAVCAGIVFIAIVIAKKLKAKNRFISKSKVQKQKQKTALKGVVYSIAPSKDNKQWFVKKNNKMFAKCKTREEAMQKTNEVKQSGDEIKVYNKAGRLIDSIK